eukprot:6402599-Amphidinium_carterae.1
MIATMQAVILTSYNSTKQLSRFSETTVASGVINKFARIRGKIGFREISCLSRPETHFEPKIRPTGAIRCSCFSITNCAGDMSWADTFRRVWPVESVDCASEATAARAISSLPRVSKGAWRQQC